MLRTEYIVVGCILVLVGISLSIVGYNEIRPSGLEQTVKVVQQLSGEKPSAQLQHPTTKGYILLAGGVLLFVAGIFFILKSRMTLNTKP